MKTWKWIKSEAAIIIPIISILLIMIGGTIFLYSALVSEPKSKPKQADCSIEKEIHRVQMDQAYDRIMELSIKLVRATEELKIYKSIGEPQ